MPIPIRRGEKYLLKIVHYINQFYAGIGGEEKADIKPEVREGFVGPGMGLNGLLTKGGAEIVSTIICGDSYFAENIDEAKAEIIEMVKKIKPDLFIAGPCRKIWYCLWRYSYSSKRRTKYTSNDRNVYRKSRCWYVQKTCAHNFN